MQLVDSATDLIYIIKRPPPEVRVISVDFKNIINEITIAVSVTPAASGLVTEVDPLTISDIEFIGTVLVFKISGGTDGEDYEVTCVVEDNIGNVISEDILVKVRKAGLI